MKFLLPAALALTAFAPPAAAQQGPVNEPKINQLIVYGDDPCPQSSDEEIVVCARKPNSDRYRIPEGLRGEGDPQSESWAARAQILETAGRTGIQSCSTVGPGGFTGCFDQLAKQWRAERAVGDGTDWNGMIAKARAERLSKIDAQSEAIEQELKKDE